MKWVLFIALLFCGTASAHSWYDSYCCGGHDCHPIASCDDITEDHFGNYHWKQFEFAHEAAMPSRDGHCHVCISNENATTPDLKPITHCLYIQEDT